SITVPVNTTITWTWAQGALTHNITPDNAANLPNSPTTVSAPFSYSATFTVAGTYDYHCTVHGATGSGMSGTVVVQ
ncbi:MAG: cupredoxin domain-containing protein, partial [Gemmatimonadales bacterium]